MILGTLFAFFTSVGIDYIHIHKHVLVATLLQPPWPRYLLGLIIIYRELVFANNLEIRMQCSSLSSQS